MQLTILTCGLVYAVTNFWLCALSDFFRVIIFACLVNFAVCAIYCNLDSQITPLTEDFQASTNWDGLPRGIEDKTIVNHHGFGSYNTKQVKSSINHLPLFSKRAVWSHHCFQELKSLILVLFIINDSVWDLVVRILINRCINIKKSIALRHTGWTNVNLLYFSDSIEIASLEGLMLWCSEINQSKRPLAWWCMTFMASRQWPSKALQTLLISDLQLQR